MPREKSRYRDRRSSSCSSDSSYEKKKSKSKHKRRSRSRDRSESSSHRRKRSSSRSRHKRRSYSRSPSRERYEKSRRRSTSRSRSRRDRSHSRSSSRSKNYRKPSKKSRRRSRSSSSRSNSVDIGNTQDSSESSEELSSILESLLHMNLEFKKKPLLSSYFTKRPALPKVNLDDTEIKIEKAIKAAEAAGLTMTKIPSYEYKEVEIKEDMPTIHDRNLIAELNSDSFVQKTFVSSRKKESKNIVIDLNAQTVKLPETELKQKDESIINFDEIPNEEELKEMWIKKLYQFRKRMLKGEI